MFMTDAAITHWINGFAGRLPILDSTLVLISEYALPLVILSLVCQWWVKAERPRIRHALAAAGFSFLGALAINQFVLLFVHRIRPYDQGITQLLISPSADFSMPSDHAAAAFAIAAAMLFQGLRGRGTVLLAAAILVSSSRVYVGTHYVSDVLAGAVTGVLAAKAVQASYRPGTRVDKLLISVL